MKQQILFAALIAGALFARGGSDMPMLNWMGREKAAKATKDVVMKILRENRELSYRREDCFRCGESRSSEGISKNPSNLQNSKTPSSESNRKMALEVLKKGPWPKFYFTKNGKGGIRRKTYLSAVGGVPQARRVRGMEQAGRRAACGGEDRVPPDALRRGDEEVRNVQRV